MEKLIIIGAGGHGRVVADIAVKMAKWKSVSFLDDNEPDKLFSGLNVIGPVSDALKYKNSADFIVAFGDNYARRNIQSDMEKKKFSIVNLIHPNTVIGSGVSFGSGNVVTAGVVINPLTKIGNGCILNTSSSIDHDNLIDDFVHIGPGVHLAGSVQVGENSSLGTGSNVINNITICKNCIIGASTLIINDIREPGTYIGIPSIRIK